MTKYIIIDTTANTGKEYINHMGENCELIENAYFFDTEAEAKKQARKYGEWAKVIQHEITFKK